MPGFGFNPANSNLTFTKSEDVLNKQVKPLRSVDHTFLL